MVGGDHILEELVSRKVVVCPVRNEVTSFRDSQVAERCASAVVSTCSVHVCFLIPDIVYFPGLTPEIFSHVKLTDPGVKSSRTILSIKFTRVNQNRRASVEECIIVL